MPLAEGVHQAMPKSNAHDVTSLHSSGYDQYQQVIPGGEISDDPNM